MAAAVSTGAARGVSVTVLERNQRVGKKLLSTGNGRCNLTNERISASNYQCGAPESLCEVIKKYGCSEIKDFFGKIGLHTQTDAEGRVYPYSLRASSVLDVLRNEITRMGHEIVTNCRVESVEYINNVFELKCAENKTFTADALIVAAGGNAAPQTGSDGFGIEVLKRFGHFINGVFPALTQLNAPSAAPLSGVRVRPCGARAYAGGEVFAREIGEVQFTEYGLSGIPIMQISNKIRGLKNFTIALDMLPFENDAEKFMEGRSLTGLFHSRVNEFLLKRSGKTPLAKPVKHLEFEVTGRRGFANAQVTGGGACLRGFRMSDMQSRARAGLFAAGEVLDACGDCGGYNLHWAFATGISAGKGAVAHCLSEGSM